MEYPVKFSSKAPVNSRLAKPKVCINRRVFIRRVATSALAVGMVTFGSSGCVSSRKKLGLAEPSAQDFIQVGANKIYRIDQGQGTPVILLHGFPDHSENQRRLIGPLARSQRVIAYDRAGLGQSEKPAIDYSIPQQVDELENVKTTLGLPRPIILGHSLGGTLAVHDAAQNPDKVSALVLMNPVLIFEPGHTGLRRPGSSLMKKQGLGEFMMLFQSRFATKTILQGMFYDQTKLTPAMIDSYHFPFEEKNTKRHFLGTLRSTYTLGTKQFLADADKIKQAGLPVLLIWTANDANMPLKDASFLAERLGAKLHVIEQCGHLPQLELNDQRLEQDLIKPIQDFFNRLHPTP